MDSDVGREWLQRHYREALAPVLAEMVPEVAEQFGFRYRGIKITAAEKRFGSCSGDNRLCFSYRLAAYPMECIHYVVCHELCHTVEKNHGPRFWALLEHICPESKALRHEMEKVYL